MKVSILHNYVPLFGQLLTIYVMPTQLNTVLGAKSGEHKFKDSENDVMVFQRWSDKQKILKSEMTTTRWKKIYIYILMDKITDPSLVGLVVNSPKLD